MMQTLGRAMGESIAKVMDVDIWLLGHPLANSCIRCGKAYKATSWGWLRRHYLRTGHWQP